RYQFSESYFRPHWRAWSRSLSRPRRILPRRSHWPTFESGPASESDLLDSRFRPRPSSHRYRLQALNRVLWNSWLCRRFGLLSAGDLYFHGLNFVGLRRNLNLTPAGREGRDRPLHQIRLGSG